MQIFQVDPGPVLPGRWSRDGKDSTCQTANQIDPAKSTVDFVEKKYFAALLEATGFPDTLPPNIYQIQMYELYFFVIASARGSFFSSLRRV